MWVVATGEVKRTLEGHTNCLYSVCVSPDNVHVLTASMDNTARVWLLAH